MVEGVFLGGALDGVLTLTAVAPSTATSVGIGLAYVAGMVSLLLTLVWARFRDRITMTSRPVTWSLAGCNLTTTTFDLAMAAVFALMAAVFALMAAVLAVVAATGASLAPDAQTAAGTWSGDRLAPVASALAPVPNWVTALVLLAGGAATVWWSPRSPSHEVRVPDPTEEEAADVHHACR